MESRIAQARNLQEKGSTAAAKQLYQSLLPTLRSSSLLPELALVQNALSQIAAGEGDYDSAIGSAREAAQIYHQIGDPDGEVLALNNKAIAEIQRGFYTAAESDLQGAIETSRAAKHFKNQAESLNNLGSAYFFQGKYFEAQRAYEEAMKVVQDEAQESWAEYWRQITAFNQATLFQRLGRYEDALHIYRQVEASSHALTPGDRAHLYANLGALYRRLGDPWKAMDTYRSALNLYSTQHDSDGEISVFKNIGIVYALDIGDLPKAEPLFARALAIAVQTGNQREAMQGHLYLGETYLRQRSLEKALLEFQNALAMSNKLGTTEEQWKSLYGVGRIKDLQGDEQAAEANYRQAIVIIEASRSQLQLSALRTDFFADKRDAYDALIASLLRKNDVPEAFSFLERSRARNFRDRLSARSSGAPDLAPSLEEMRKHLDDSTVLFEFWTAADEVALIWCTHDGYGAVQKHLSPPILRQVLSLVRSTPESLGQDWRHQRMILDQVFDNLPTLQPSIHHALIVPDGWLSFVPFDLVRADSSSDALLIERFDISYLPTAVLLRRSDRDPKLAMPWQYELVAFGGPVFQSDLPMQTEAQVQNSGLAPVLPYAGNEIQAIATMTNGKDKLFLAAADKKKEFLAGRANDAWILHVSTHAFADSDNPENSRMLFSSASPGEQPDYVYLRELYDLDLSRVNLATLSACDTERGRMVRGEGVQAFSRALLAAGARSSLTTLWRVADQPTEEFMKQFYYFALQERLPKAEALRRAKLKFLHSGSAMQNPSHWAAFVLNGDGLNPLPKVVSWKMIAASALALAACLAIAVMVLTSRQQRRNHGIHGPQ